MIEPMAIITASIVSANSLSLISTQKSERIFAIKGARPTIERPHTEALKLPELLELETFTPKNLILLDIFSSRYFISGIDLYFNLSIFYFLIPNIGVFPHLAIP